MREMYYGKAHNIIRYTKQYNICIEVLDNSSPKQNYI